MSAAGVSKRKELFFGCFKFPETFSLQSGEEGDERPEMTPTTFGASKGQNEKGNQTMNKLHTNKKPLLLGLSCKRKITAGIMAAILTLLAGPALAFSPLFFYSRTTPPPLSPFPLP